MSTVLVTGGRGFIGTNLVRELRQRGHQVETLDTEHAETDFGYRVDVANYRELRGVLASGDFEYVYHLAAEYGRWNGEAHYEKLWHTNVVGTKNLLRLQEELGFRHIFFSSCEVYGDYEGLMTEDLLDRVPIKQMNDYAISKWAGELQVMNSALMFGTQTVRVRPLNCYGPHEPYSPYRGVIPIMLYHALTGRRFRVNAGHVRVFDYVDDTVRTLANIVDNFIPGEVYNIGSSEDWGVDIRDLAEMVIDVTGADPALAEVESFEAFTTRTKIVDLSKSRRDLDHQATVPLRDGLERYARWMREHYAIMEGV